MTKVETETDGSRFIRRFIFSLVQKETSFRFQEGVGTCRIGVRGVTDDDRTLPYSCRRPHLYGPLPWRDGREDTCGS